MLLLTQRTISKAITITSTCILALSPFTNADGFEIGFTYADNNSDADSAGKFCPANTQIRATVKGINANDMEVWIETLKSSDEGSLSSSGQHGPFVYELSGDTITITKDKNSDLFSVVQKSGTIFQVNVMVKSQKASIGLQACREAQGSCSQWNCPTMTTSGCAPYDALYKALPDDFNDSGCPIPGNKNLPNLHSLPPKFLTQNCPETKSFVPPTIDAKMKFYMSTKLVGTVNQQHCEKYFMMRKAKSDETPHVLVMAGSFDDFSSGDDNKYDVALEAEAADAFKYAPIGDKYQSVEWWEITDENNPIPVLNFS